MKKTMLTICLLASLALHASEKLKVDKKNNTRQFYELTTVNSLSFSDPGIAKLKLKKADGSILTFNLSDIININFSAMSDIEKSEVLKKIGIDLLGNYPNPFNPTTTVSFTTSTQGLAKVEVFNQNGQMVSTLHSGNLTAGSHSMPWDAKNATSGTYFVRVSQNGETISNKMLLLK